MVLLPIEVMAAEVLSIVKKERVSVRRVLESKYRVPRQLRATVFALALGVLRSYRLLERLLEIHGVELEGMRVRDRFLALTVAYEVLYRDRMPPTGFKLPFPREVLMELRNARPEDALKGLGGVEKLAVKYSVPDWVAEYAVNLLGWSEAEELLEALSKQPPRWARARAPRSMVLEKLRERGVEAVEDEDLPDVFLVKKSPGNLASLPEHREGLFILQDKASAYVVHLLKPEPGTMVLDACSAPGTKALHVLDLYKGVEVIAADVSWNRLRDEKKLLASYVKAGRAQLVCIDSQKLAATRKFKRILVDPDCSSLGKLAHSPEVKLWLKPRHVTRNAELQYGILSNAAKLLDKDGIIVYSTCTITLEENEKVVKRIVEEQGLEPVEPELSIGDPGIGLPQARRLYPHRHGTAGFFVAILQRA